MQKWREDWVKATQKELGSKCMYVCMYVMLVSYVGSVLHHMNIIRKLGSFCEWVVRKRQSTQKGTH